METIEKSDYEQKIVELESNLERAALFGKQLLDQLSLKSSESDELLERCTGYEIQLDSLKQKLYSAQREVDLVVARERNALNEIECLKEVIIENEGLQRDHKASEEKIRNLESEKQRRLQIVAELEDNLHEVRTELSLAKTQIEEQKLLEKQSQTVTSERNNAVIEDEENETEVLMTKIDSLQAEIENLRTILKQTVEEKELIIKENHRNQNKLDEALEDKSSFETEMTFLMNAVNEKNRRIEELKEEIEVLKAAETDPTRRGNSIFAEVEDRRLKVEAKLVEAKARLQFANESQRRLKVQLAHCYTSLQVMAAHSSKADQNYVKTLEKEIIRLRAELMSAATRVALVKSSNDLYTEKDLQDNPLAGLLLSERRQTALLKKKIEEFVHHEEKRTQELLKLSSDLRISQSEVENLQKQRSILMLKLKEKQINDRDVENPSPRVEIIKEVLQDVVQETERNKRTEEKLTSQLEDGTSEIPTKFVAEAAGEPFRKQDENKENLCAVHSNETEMAVKTVNFDVVAEKEKAKPAPRPKGHRVTVVKRSKAETDDCKTQ